MPPRDEARSERERKHDKMRHCAFCHSTETGLVAYNSSALTAVGGCGTSCHWDVMAIVQRRELLKRLGFGKLARIAFGDEKWVDLPAYVRMRIIEENSDEH